MVGTLFRPLRGLAQEGWASTALAPDLGSLCVHLLAVAATVAMGFPAAAQIDTATDATGAGSPRYVRQAWTVEDGLPVNSINGLLQSRDGYLWAATFDGLVRFDGVRFEVYGTGSHPGLPSNRILDMWETSDGSLWLKTEQNHLVRFRDERFIHFGPDRGVLADTVEILYEDRERAVWIGTSEGVSVLRGERFEPWARDVIDARTTSLHRHGDGSLWVGLWDGRVFRERDGVLEDVADPGDRPVGVRSIAEGEDGAVWIASEQGIFRVAAGPAERMVPEDGISGRAVHEILPGEAPGEAWMYTRAGVFRLGESGLPELSSGRHHAVFRRYLLQRDDTGDVWYAFGTELFRNGERIVRLDSGGTQDPTPREEIRAFAQDHEGSVWIGTNAAGLHRLKPAVFSMLGEPEGLAYHNVYSVYEHSSGAVYVGTWGGGFAGVDAGAIENFPPDDVVPRFITSFAEAPDGALWVGSFGGGILRCTVPPGPCARLFSDGPLAGAQIFALYRSGTGAVWIGSDAGLFRYDGAGLTSMSGAPGAPPTVTRAFAETQDGALWAGTNGGGLYRYLDDEFVNVGEQGGLSSNLVRSLYVDGEGWLWIGTEGRGLVRLDPTAFTAQAAAGSEARDRVSAALRSIRRIDGLFDEVVHQILEDEDGRIWMSTNRGIFWVARDELHAFADGLLARVHSTGYTERDGLRNREANGGVQPAGIRSSDGRLWFATQAGVAIVDPDDLRANRVAPRIVVERVVTESGTLQPLGGPISLEPSQRDLEIQYTALSFLAPENVRFRYRLDAYNSEWVEAGNRRVAFYTGVPPGTYSFRVMASAHEGVWSDPAQLDLTVEPRFTETRSYYLLVALGLAMLGLAALRLRDDRVRANEARLAGLVEERTRRIRRHERQLEEQNAQLESQAARLAALDAAKSRFFANISHEFRTPLTLTIGPLEDVRSGIRGAVSSDASADLDLALRNARRLLRLVNQILDVSRLEAGQLRPKIREDDLGELVRGIAEGFQPLAERRRIDFRVEITDEDLCFFLDADLLEKVFTNLLSNAFKFTEEGGSVLLQVATRPTGEAGGEGVITVRDTGPGIPASDLPHIFERFYRGGEARAGGTGIGLSLARELIELHGGRIDVTSELGFGSTFEVVLIRGSAHLEPSWVVPADRARDAPGKPPDPAEIAPVLESSVTSAGQDAELDLDRTTILVVDDSADVRSYIRRHLSDSHRIIDARDGREGLETAERELPDVVISDVMMPEMNGFELCRRLKSNPATSFIPVILVTAKATREEKLAGLDSGADDYVTKPFDPVELGARARNLVQARRRLWQHVRYEARLHPDPPPPASSEESFLDRLRRTVEAHIDDETFDVETLALALGYSRAALYRRLESLVEESPAEIILGIRLERAAQLLHADERTVSEVAYGVGFKSVSHFSRRFKRRFGVSPSEFRAQPTE